VLYFKIPLYIHTHTYEPAASTYVYMITCMLRKCGFSDQLTRTFSCTDCQYIVYMYSGTVRDPKERCVLR
jgi:hypothetical protein